jgi:hypothetical protein
MALGFGEIKDSLLVLRLASTEDFRSSSQRPTVAFDDLGNVIGAESGSDAPATLLPIRVPWE